MRRSLILLFVFVVLLSTPPLAAARSSGPALRIFEIQGPGTASPFAGQKLARPVRGCVTGVAAEGFYLQDPHGDGNPDTSDGIYVYRYSAWKNPRRLQPGDLVEISSYKVSEFYGQTELNGLSSDKNAAYRVLGRCALPAPVLIEPPIPMNKPPVEQYERLEGQRISISFEASVAGPTQRFESRHPAGDPEITLAPLGSPLWGVRIPAQLVPVDVGTITLTGGLGVDLPAVNTFDHLRAEGLTGILAYQFGRYVFLVENPEALQVTSGALTPAAVSPAAPDEWTLCTFNAENLFDPIDDGDGDAGAWVPANNRLYRTGLQRRATLVKERLGGCTVLALQEVEGKDAVWADLARELGPSYRFDYKESADVRDITVGVIYDGDRVELMHGHSATACSAADYRVDDTAARGPRADLEACPSATYPLYDRSPYVADVVVANAAQDRRAEFRLIVVHLKSKRGDEAENEMRRLAQARHVAGLLAEAREDRVRAIALGDFNDDLGTAPMAELSPFVNLYERHVPPNDRYSYIYNGRSQAFDHVVLTQEMDAYYLAGGPVHVNADFAEPLPGSQGRTSDHDPLVVRFRFQPTGISTALAGVASGGMGYHHSLRLK